jgi:hypothetical protein
MASLSSECSCFLEEMIEFTFPHIGLLVKFVIIEKTIIGTN